MVIIGILAAVLVVCVVSKWWVEGSLNGSEMVIVTAIYSGLVFGLFAVETIAARILVLMPLLGSAGWAIYGLKKESLRQYYKDKLRIYERAIQADPRNTAARSAMAEAYYATGDLDSAIAAMEIAVQMEPNSIKDSYKLRQWQEERELRDSETVVCQNCHSQNIWGSTKCRTCGYPLVYPIRRNVSKAFTGYIIAGILWIAFSIFAFIWLPLKQSVIVAACGALTAIGWLMLSSSKRQ